MVLALSIGLTGCEGEGEGEPEIPEAILVGLARDLDSVLVFYDWAAGGPVYRAFNQTVNAGGGIFMSGYNATLPLELVIRNYDPLSPGDLTIQTEALITQDDVHFLWGGPGTTTVYTQSEVANAYGIVLMTLEGGATDMLADPEKLDSWPYTWINLSFSDWYQIPVLHASLVDKGVSQPKAYVLYIDNEHGAEYSLTTENVFGAGNVTSVGHAAFGTTYQDIEDAVFDAQVALNQSGSGPDYDVFCAFTYDPILSDVVNACVALDFNPPAIMMGPGAETGVYLLTFGDTLEGMCGFAVANRDTVIAETTSMSLPDMFDLCMAAGTGPFPPFAYESVWAYPVLWAGLEMWKAAVEEVGHLDVGYSAEVRNALASFTAGNEVTTVMGDCWYEVFGGGFGGGVIDYEAMPGQICQWQSGYAEIVGPSTPPYSKYDTTATFEYPMTGQWNWLDG